MIMLAAMLCSSAVAPRDSNASAPAQIGAMGQRRKGERQTEAHRPADQQTDVAQDAE